MFGEEETKGWGWSGVSREVTYFTISLPRRDRDHRARTSLPRASSSAKKKSCMPHKRFPASVASFFFLPEAWQNTNGVLGSIVFCRPPSMVRTYHFHTAVHRGGRLRLASICAKRGAGVERTTAALQQAGTSCKRGASGYHDAPL